MDNLEFDIVIVGAGPAGLACAIELKKKALQSNNALEIAIFEKGSDIGSHILSGCVLDPGSLYELIPEWKSTSIPGFTPVSAENFHFLTKNKAFPLPCISHMDSRDCHVGSLGLLCQSLAEIAESLEIALFPGFPIDDFIIKDNTVIGLTTKARGIDKNGQKTECYEEPFQVFAKYVVLAEGARGSLSKKIIQFFQLDKNSKAQTYGLGFKELWRIPSAEHTPGKIEHFVGWPLFNKAHGGGFVYHYKDNLLGLGLIAALDYSNPNFHPYEEFQRLKHHPTIEQILQGGERICYGARVINEGGIQSLPQLAFPGGLLIGCSAGFLNAARLKGTHLAIESGRIAAHCIFKYVESKNHRIHIGTEYNYCIRHSTIYKELYKVRNIRPYFKFGLIPGLILSGIDSIILRGYAPWTLSHNSDHQSLKKRNTPQSPSKICYDGKLSFDKLTNLHYSSTSHNENQPSHLVLKSLTTPITLNLLEYNSPESRYCPAGVYEIVRIEGRNKLKINASNCLHCKACDIKDVSQNIIWTVPEGGGGPEYFQM